MRGGYKIICVTPAGRMRYMRLLAPYILSAKSVDEWHIWINTTNHQDISFIQFLEKLSPKVILVPQPENQVSGNRSINAFFRNCIHEDTIYIRFDDDIVWMENDFIDKLVDHRVSNPNYFLTFPLIINNAVCTHLLQIHNKIKISKYVPAQCMGDLAWKNPKFASEIHRWFLRLLKNNEYKNIYIDKTIPIALNRFSINCMAWFGATFRKFNGVVLGDEEEYLTVIKPAELGLVNAIFGSAITTHFAFFPQRNYLDRTNILSEYGDLLKNPDSPAHTLYKQICSFEYKHQRTTKITLKQNTRMTIDYILFLINKARLDRETYICF